MVTANELRELSRDLLMLSLFRASLLVDEAADALEATPPAQGYSQEAPNYNPDAHVIACSQVEPKATETGGSLFGNCDARGAKELFARLVNAVERRGAAAGAGDGAVYALYNSIASSSADRLVSDYANTINAALSALEATTPAPKVTETALPQDVIDLVIAAREFWDANDDLSPESRALDKALEEFSSRVPYAEEPDTLTAAQESGQ